MDSHKGSVNCPDLPRPLLIDLNLNYPIIQAPMALADTPGLVAAISNEGGLGSLGAALFDPEQIRTKIHEIRSLTNKPFNINLFAPTPTSIYTSEQLDQACEAYNFFRAKLGLPLRHTADIKPTASFEEKLAVIVEEKVPVFSFTFGILPAKIIQTIQSQGIKVIGTATTVREAKLLEASGVDAIVAQGYEAGGHRGTDLQHTNIEDALIGTMALVPQVVDAVKIPVIASGGIMDARGICAALALGASGVQMGTVFLTSHESSIHQVHRERLLNSTDESTCLTNVFTGRMARSIKNDFIKEVSSKHLPVLDFSIQRALIKDLMEAGKAQHHSDYLSLWAGQGSALCQDKAAAEIFKELIAKLR